MFGGYFGRRRLKTLLISTVISLIILLLISVWKNISSTNQTHFIPLKKPLESDFDSLSNDQAQQTLPSILSSIDFTNSPYLNFTSLSSNIIPIIVLSKASNIEIRDAIRRTWAFDGLFRNDSIDIKVFFLVGTDDHTINRIHAEQLIFDDVIHVAIPESDSFMAYKELSAMIWIRTYLSNARFYIKTEDDVIMNIKAIVEILLPTIEHVRYENVVIGWFGSKHFVKRGVYQKFVDAMMPPSSMNLAYAMSLFYVITAEAANRMLDVLTDIEFIQQSGDPFVTGILRDAAKVQIKNLAIDSAIYRYEMSNSSCTDAFKENAKLLFCSTLIYAGTKRSTPIYFEAWNTLLSQIVNNK